MENLLLLFENISSVNRALIMVSGITFYWIIEGIVPFKFLDYKKWKHSIPNFLLNGNYYYCKLFFSFYGWSMLQTGQMKIILVYYIY